MQSQPLGAHVSIAGGVYKSISNGERIGATAIQIFSKNQTRWVARPLSDEDAEAFQKAWHNSPIQEVVIHDSYLINLGSPKEDLLQKSREAFLDEVERAEKLGIRYLVFHPGSHIGAGEEIGLKTIAESLNWTIERTQDHSVMLLLETTAGQGTNLGYKFEQLAAIMDMVEDKSRLGVCLDTAHIFAAGYDIRTPKVYEETIHAFDRILGLKNLFCIHMNDSKKELASRVDRHDHLGEGFLGMEPFRLILNDSRLARIPKILEIPGDENDFKRNLDLMKSLVQT